jgi:hypothetical protein
MTSQIAQLKIGLMDDPRVADFMHDVGEQARGQRAHERRIEQYAADPHSEPLRAAAR